MTHDSAYDPIIRPAPLRYVAFVYGAALPDRNRGWVRHALTSDAWMTRALLRGQLAMLPLYAIILAMPGNRLIQAGAVLLGIFLVTFYNVVYMRQNRARRLQKNGLDPNLENPRLIVRREEFRRRYEAEHPPVAW